MTDLAPRLANLAFLCIAVAPFGLTGCGGEYEGSTSATGTITGSALSPAAQLGDSLFEDVPTLRNIALTAPYFHNGVFDTLQEVLEWYVTRDINNNLGNNPNPVAAGPGGNPYIAGGSFYVAADGSADEFEYTDLPVLFDANVNVNEVPYTPPKFAGGQSPTLDADDINAVVTFLCTLTDGFDPDHPAAYALPAQCQAASAAASQHSSAD